ncbi:DNA repair protein RecO [Polaribacter sp.]|uniref:DNA repair protein RecO n=1 Tax=Polaribacter sp. TaxID=1920175 RepID=UPI00404720E2
MPIITTNAIVLSSLKFGDSSLIVKCFTQQDGVKSYMVRGILKAKKGGLKVAYFQPLTQLKLVANHNTKNTLNTIKEIQVLQPYQTIYQDIVKQSITFFLSEVVSNVIQEEETNEELYTFLESSFHWLDTHEKIANFHLVFLVKLTSFLGFYPDTSEVDKKGFHLQEGFFTDETYDKNVISGNDFFHFKKLLNANFENCDQLSFSKFERQQVLQVLISYYKLHIDSFRNPKSLDVLEAVFS